MDLCVGKISFQGETAIHGWLSFLPLHSGAPHLDDGHGNKSNKTGNLNVFGSHRRKKCQVDGHVTLSVSAMSSPIYTTVCEKTR